MSAAAPLVDWFRAGLRLPLLIGGAALAFYGLVLADPYGQRLLTIAGCYALMVLGYQFIFGHAGALSLAQGTFFGLGAYVTGILGSQLGWSFPLTFALSIGLPVLTAVGLSQAVQIPVAAFASLGNWSQGNLNIGLGATIAVTDVSVNPVPLPPSIYMFGFASLLLVAMKNVNKLLGFWYQLLPFSPLIDQQ